LILKKDSYFLSLGFASFHTTFFAALYFLKDTGVKPLEFVYDHYVGLAFASIIFSYIISFAVYFSSFKRGKLLALGGNTGNAIYDVNIIHVKCLCLH
jgi:hypothetical protein